MSAESDLIHEFIVDMAAKGYITIGKYLNLDRALHIIDGTMPEKIEYG